MQATVQQVLEYTKRSLENITGSKVEVSFCRTPNINEIEKLKQAVCMAYGITIKEFETRRRYQRLVRPRQMFSYFASVKLGMRLIDVGNAIKMDHTAVIFNREKIRGLFHIGDEDTITKYELVNEYLKSKL